jgi:hypothetical protein
LLSPESSRRKFDKGGEGIAYSSIVPTNAVSDYRITKMLVSPATNTLGTTDLGGGYCVDNLRSGECLNFTIDVRKKRNYWVEPRVAGIGTNGAFNIEFYTNNVKYTETGPLVVKTLDWSNLGKKNVLLNAGTNVMKIVMLTNGVTGSNHSGAVAKLNYVSIYPSWDEGVSATIGATVTLTNLVTGTNWSDALTNAQRIQAALDSFNSLPDNSTGILELQQTNTFLVSQSDIDVSAFPWRHSAVTIPRNNILIRGAGLSNTILMAFNRATTIFCVGGQSPTAAARTNVVFSDLGFEARPHLVGYKDTNIIVNYWEKGGLAGTNGIWNFGFGAPIVLTGYANLDGDLFYTKNVLITNCLFRNADRAIATVKAVSDVLICSNKFITWDGDNGRYYGQTNTGIYPDGPVSDDTDITAGTAANIFGTGENSDGFVIVDNEYHGSPWITNIVSDLGLYAPDGFVWVFRSGNYYVGRNSIKNYSLEAIQFNAGPFAVWQNVFQTFVHNGATCTVNAGMTWPSLNADARDDMGSVVGNSIDGGRHLYQTVNDVSPTPPRPGKVIISGNLVRLDQPFKLLSDPYGAVASLDHTAHLNLSGNKLTDGYLAAVFDKECTNGFVLKNDFSGARQGGVFLRSETLLAHIYAKNTLNAGVSYHFRAGLAAGSKMFSVKDSFSNPSNEVLDSSGLPVHISR